MSSTLVQIPIIDFEPFINDRESARQTVVEQIYQACHKIGFMYLKNSGISQNLIDQLFIQAKQFFNLPYEVKQQLAWSDEFSNRGYVGIERERLDPDKPGDLKEAFNVGKEGDKGDKEELKASQSSLSVPFSAVSLAKDPCILAFWNASTAAADRILQAFALALQLPEDFFSSRHDQQNHTLRLLHYPPLQKLPKPGQVRAGEHSDYGSITLLFQDRVGGLEVQTRDGKWIAAPSIPGTVVVNTGDLMQRWTNHVFCSTKHRVMIPTDEQAKQSRYSVAFFCHPNNDTEISCLPSCQGADRPVIYPPISARDYLISRLQATY
jgi:isopenicillin N synthase-like dioxygenase